MKKIIAAALCLLLVLSLTAAGCGRTGGSSGGDRPAAIMADGALYYSTGTVYTAGVDDSLIQYAGSYAEDGVPDRDGETNFCREPGTPYALPGDGTVVVLIGGEWIVFRAK